MRGILWPILNTTTFWNIFPHWALRKLYQAFRVAFANDVTNHMPIIDQPPTVAGDLLLELYDGLVENQGDQVVTNVGWKGKGKAVALDGGEVVADSETLPEPLVVDWTRYEPPDGLRYTGDIESDTVIQIIQDSIDKIKARILEEEEQKSAAKAARQKQKEKAHRKKEEEKDDDDDEEPKDPERNAIPLHDEPAQTNEPHQLPDPEQDQERGLSKANGTGAFFGRTVMSLFRKLNGSAEHGESSASGAARHSLLAQTSQVELTTYSARNRSVLDLLGGTASTQEPKV
jgi:hypothetical protein